VVIHTPDGSRRAAIAPDLISTPAWRRLICRISATSGAESTGVPENISFEILSRALMSQDSWIHLGFILRAHPMVNTAHE